MAMTLSKNFEQMRAIFEEVLKVKNAGGHQHEVTDKRKYALLMFVLIKKLNRTEKYGLRSGREELHRTKVQVDSNRLQLQNLLYEVGYLRREIRNCYQFKSQDEDIDLLSEKDYLAVSEIKGMPEKIAGATSKHEKHLLRLEGELDLRKNLSVQCKELANSKKQVLQDIVLKMERLTSFAPSLRTLAKATRPLQEALQTPFEREWRLGRLVQLLPQPLYVAYMHMHAFEPEFNVAIVGVEKDVHEIEMAVQLEKINEDSVAEENQRTRILAPHPLMVQFSIENKGIEKERVVVSLRYFPRLGFATASSNLNLNDTEGEMLTSSDILKTLYEGDGGNDIPISKAEYELKKIFLTPVECLEHLKSRDLGTPYRWVQRMCSIEAYTADSREGTEVRLQDLIIVTIKDISNAWNSRLNLIKQITALVNKNAELYLKDEQMPLSKPCCSLVQWTSITWDEYVATSITESYIQSDLVDGNNMFYRAVVVRGSAKMECLISVPNKFPAESPVWVVSVYWNGLHNASNSAAIKQLEFLTNSVRQEQLHNEFGLLAFQLYHTMFSLDIFLETEGPLFNPVEYSKDKHYIKAFTKRIRARPYRFVKDGPTSSFKQ